MKVDGEFVYIQLGQEILRVSTRGGALEQVVAPLSSNAYINDMDVKDGQFQGKAEPGERRVEIYAYRVKTGNFSGMKGEVKENLIPVQYNTNSQLTASVTAEGPNQFTFPLKKR